MSAGPTLSGIYYNPAAGYQLSLRDDGFVQLIPDTTKTEVSPEHARLQNTLRADKSFFLSKDDGQIGRLGVPEHVRTHVDDVAYKLWVEPRGFSQDAYELGLILTDDEGNYSNKFLGVDPESRRFIVKGTWPTKEPKDPSLIWRVNETKIAEV